MIKFTFWYSTGDCAEGKIIWVTACSTGVSIRCLYTTGLHTFMAIHSLYWYTYRPIILVILSSGGSWSSVEILTETRDLWVRSLVYVDIGLTNGLNIIVLESLNIWEGGTGSALLGLLVMFGHKSCWSLIFKNILVYEQISWSVKKFWFHF